MMYALNEMKMFDLVFEYLVKPLLEAMEAVAMIPEEHLNIRLSSKNIVVNIYESIWNPQYD